MDVTVLDTYVRLNWLFKYTYYIMNLAFIPTDGRDANTRKTPLYYMWGLWNWQVFPHQHFPCQWLEE